MCAHGRTLKRAKVRICQHIPGATHGIATEAAIVGKDVLKDVVGGVHGEERRGERNSVPDRLGKSLTSIGRIRTMPVVF